MPLSVKNSGVWRTVKQLFAKRNGQFTPVRHLYVKNGGQWRECYLYAPGNASYSKPGTYSFIVPTYGVMNVDVMSGSGGGGGGSDHYPYLYCYGGGPGISGAESRFNAPTPIFATPGKGGAGGPCGGPVTNGADGVGVNGDTNTTGSAGGAGGNGSGPGQPSYGGNGGKSGRALKQFVVGNTGGYPVWGSTISIVVGAGGAGGGPGNGYCAPGGVGASGYVNISWSQ